MSCLPAPARRPPSTWLRTASREKSSPHPGTRPERGARLCPMPSTLYRDTALADGRGPRLQVGVSILVRDGRIAWIRPAGAEEAPGPAVEVVDASGGTAVPGMVDTHSHRALARGA